MLILKPSPGLGEGCKVCDTRTLETAHNFIAYLIKLQGLAQPWCCLLIQMQPLRLWASVYSVVNSFTLQLTSPFPFIVPACFPLSSHFWKPSHLHTCQQKYLLPLFTVLQSRRKDSHSYCFFSSQWSRSTVHNCSTKSLYLRAHSVLNMQILSKYISTIK